MPLRSLALIAVALLFAPALPAPAQQPAAAPTPWIRADSKFVAAIEAARFFDGPEKEQIAEISTLHPVVITYELPAAVETTGLNPSDVVRLVVSEELPAGVAAIVETVGEPQADLLCSKLAPGAKPTVVANRTRYVGQQFALSPLAPQTVLVSTPPVLEAVMNRLDASPGLIADLPPIDGADAAIVDIVARPSFLVGHPELAGAPPEVATLLSATQMRIRFEPAKALTFRWTGEYADEPSAAAAEKAFHFIAAQLVSYMAKCEQNMPPMLKASVNEYPGAEKLASIYVQTLQAASAALQAASISREGANVSMVCSIATDRPVTDAILLLSLMPRAAK